MRNITPIYHDSSNILQEYSFDAWGRRRNPTDWGYDLTGQPELFADRGFTSHEYLKYFNIYNMNGRLYDPLVGRFLSPDPVIQDPTSTQNLNRYSYCLNNPLKYNDPSGNTYLEYMDATYGEGNYYYRGGAPSGSRGGGSHGGGGSSNSFGRGITYGAPSYEQWANKKNAETTWITLGFYYYDENGKPITKNENSGEFWIYEATTNNYFVNSYSNKSNAASEGGERDWLDKTQIGIGALDVAHGAKEELINYAAKLDPAINSMKYVKAVKVVSKGIFVAQAGISVFQAGSAFVNQDGNKWGVTSKAALDITMGAITVWGGPVGWAAGGVYFVGDVAGWWGNWGDPLTVNKQQ